MKTFEDMDLLPELQRALAEQRYACPTPIQAKTIPEAVGGADILGSAKTGTGKTAAFALPTLNLLGTQRRRPKPNRPAALVIAPTRELAIQIADSFRRYGKHLRLQHALVYGGVGQFAQVKALRRGVDILIATPGRLLDLMTQGHIDLSDIRMFVLDEADRMLDMGFMPDLEQIIASLPVDRQSLFFSATLPPNIRKLASQLLFNPVRVTVDSQAPSVEQIDQSVRFVESKDKLSMLNELLEHEGVGRAIVFTRTKRTANGLAQKLDKLGLRVSAIHGDKTQSARQKALTAFRRSRIDVLVATDVAARGIDIDGITHVVNYDMPVEPESYIHRIGRTGRAGANGIAVSFCTANEMNELQAIETISGTGLRIENPESRFVAPTDKKRRRNRGKTQGFKSSGKRRAKSQANTPSFSEGGGNRKRRQKPTRRRKLAADD